MMKTAKIAVLAAMTAVLAVVPVRAEPVVLEVQCLCKLGHKPDWYKGTIALTDQSRDAMKAMIESGAVELWKQVTLKGKGCNAGTFPDGWKDKCGETSVSHRSADGKRTVTNVPNAEFTGEVTIEVKSNFGIPKARELTSKVIKVNEARWPKTKTIGVMGVDVNAAKKKPIKKSQK